MENIRSYGRAVTDGGNAKTMFHGCLGTAHHFELQEQVRASGAL
jgi:hypothetical protein